MDSNLDGKVVVDFEFTVRSGVTVTAPSGELTVGARNLTVDNMGTITILPKSNKYGRGTGSGPTAT